MDPVWKAIGFAARRHEGQTRKDGLTPFVAHPVRVMLCVLREFGETDPETLAAAVLHDTIEDTATDFDDIEREFGPGVARMVAALTKDKRLPEDEREARYFEGLREAPFGARLCKIADTLDNLRDALPGKRAKALRKAQRLIEIFGADAQCARALAALRAEMERGGASQG